MTAFEHVPNIIMCRRFSIHEKNKNYLYPWPRQQQ